MFSKVYGIGLQGVEGHLVHVEVDVSDGLPSFVMVGVLAPEVREAQDRVRTALKNAGFRFTPKKVTVNLSPADIRKNGTGFDLPVAAAVLGAYGQIDWRFLEDAVLLGELGLDGQVKAVRGVLPMVMAAKACGKKVCYLPQDNEREGSVIPDIRIVGVRDIRQLVEIIHRREFPGKEDSVISEYELTEQYQVDYDEVQGQHLMRRATEVAVAGRHNLMYIGSAGTGKTMIAERIPTIMPSCTLEEQLEISKVYSICGLLSKEQPFVNSRPFRSPHHSVTAQALTGGGRNPIPGEMSLASEGVLFLDELPEFSRYAIEVMRQPLESHRVVLSRVSGRYEFPADFMLVAALNPCPCGHYPDRSRCMCSDAQIRHYLGKISKPILDRIDICVEAAPVTYDDLRSTRKGESSAAIRRRVERVREIQKERFKDSSIRCNSQMNSQQIRRYCCLEPQEERFFKDLYQKKGFSARAYSKILKVARTIADLDESEQIMHKHLCEAIGYRSLEEKYWKQEH